MSWGEVSDVLVPHQSANDGVKAPVVDKSDVSPSDDAAMSWLTHSVLSWYGGKLKKGQAAPGRPAVTPCP